MLFNEVNSRPCNERDAVSLVTIKLTLIIFTPRRFLVDWPTPLSCLLTSKVGWPVAQCRALDDH